MSHGWPRFYEAGLGSDLTSTDDKVHTAQGKSRYLGSSLTHEGGFGLSWETGVRSGSRGRLRRSHSRTPKHNVPTFGWFQCPRVGPSGRSMGEYRAFRDGGGGGGVSTTWS